jgi:hypothetical protein
LTLTVLVASGGGGGDLGSLEAFDLFDDDEESILLLLLLLPTPKKLGDDEGTKFVVRFRLYFVRGRFRLLLRFGCAVWMCVLLSNAFSTSFLSF